jgi:flavorubredoxin
MRLKLKIINKPISLWKEKIVLFLSGTKFLFVNRLLGEHITCYQKTLQADLIDIFLQKSSTVFLD